jgi:hypothetical protein
MITRKDGRACFGRGPAVHRPSAASRQAGGAWTESKGPSTPDRYARSRMMMGATEQESSGCVAVRVSWRSSASGGYPSFHSRGR